MTRSAGGRTSTPLKLIEGTGEAIPVHDRTIDAVLTTWTMRSVPAIELALQEMRRVLKPNGRSPVRRTRACVGAGSALVARSPHADMEALFRRLPPKPPYSGINAARGLSYRVPRNGLHAPRTQTDDLHVRGQCQPTISRPRLVTPLSSASRKALSKSFPILFGPNSMRRASGAYLKKSASCDCVMRSSLQLALVAIQLLRPSRPRAARTIFAHFSVSSAPRVGTTFQTFM
jgi:hypothetical protein